MKLTPLELQWIKVALLDRVDRLESEREKVGDKYTDASIAQAYKLFDKVADEFREKLSEIEPLKTR
jgi:hypothetical protein